MWVHLGWGVWGGGDGQRGQGPIKPQVTQAIITARKTILSGKLQRHGYEPLDENHNFLSGSGYSCVMGKSVETDDWDCWLYRYSS